MTSLIKYLRKSALRTFFFCFYINKKKLFQILFSLTICWLNVFSLIGAQAGYMKKVTKGNILRIPYKDFFECAFPQYIGLFWAKHCIVWKLTDIDMKYPWREFSILCMLPFIAELTWIESIRCGGFECPINNSTCENKNQADCCLLTIFFLRCVRTASKVDLLAIFLLLKIRADQVILCYKAT